MTDEVVSRGDIYLVSLNPKRGLEIRETRPCVVFCPDELNAHLRTFIACAADLMISLVTWLLINSGLSIEIG